MFKVSVNLSILFQEVSLAQRFESAARAGFDTVEIWFPYELPAQNVRDLLRDNGLRCIGINTPAGDVASGDWGLAADPSRRVQFEASLDVAFRYAQQIECPNVHVMAGHQSKSVSVQAAWENYLHCIGTACDRAGDYGLTVMIEPLNAIDRPLYLLQTQSQAIEAVLTLNRTNLKIMLDIYHLQRGEGNLIERMRHLFHTPHTFRLPTIQGDMSLEPVKLTFHRFSRPSKQADTPAISGANTRPRGIAATVLRGYFPMRTRNSHQNRRRPMQTKHHKTSIRKQAKGKH